MPRPLTRYSRKLVDISDNDGKGAENTVWLCRELQKHGVESLQVQRYNGEPGFHRILVPVRYLELAKRLLQQFGTKQGGRALRRIIRNSISHSREVAAR